MCATLPAVPTKDIRVIRAELETYAADLAVRLAAVREALKAIDQGEQ